MQNRLGAISFLVLVLLFCLTTIAAWTNAVDEEVYSFKSTLWLTFAGVISQIPGLFIALYRWRKKFVGMSLSLFVAYFLAITGLWMYLIYALNGSTKFREGAQHMHIVLFPVFHQMLAACLYGLVNVGRILSPILAWVREDELPT